MINTHRLLVRGHRVEYVAAVDEKLIADNIASFQYKYMFYASLIVIVILLMIIIHLKRKKKRIERTLRNNAAKKIVDKSKESEN